MSKLIDLIEARKEAINKAPSIVDAAIFEAGVYGTGQIENMSPLQKERSKRLAAQVDAMEKWSRV